MLSGFRLGYVSEEKSAPLHVPATAMASCALARGCRHSPDSMRGLLVSLQEEGSQLPRVTSRCRACSRGWASTPSRLLTNLKGILFDVSYLVPSVYLLTIAWVELSYMTDLFLSCFTVSCSVSIHCHEHMAAQWDSVDQ
jgi:hypothetical protein